MNSEATPTPPWITRHGTADAPPARISLRAGPLSMEFEDGDLRYIRLGGREIIRRIYAMVRDGSWNSYPGKILRIETKLQDNSFIITYEAEHAGDIETGGKVRFKNRVRITGDADGSLGFSMQGISHQRFLSNRIGICVLHPTPDIINTPVTIEHVDGNLEQGTFPAEVSQTLPFTDIRAITTQTSQGHGMELRFSGGVFEMEDQRNYGDSSFKTFSTPLRLPKPVDIVVGARIDQEVLIRLVGTPPPHLAEPAIASVSINSQSTFPLAKIGFGIRELEGADLQLPLLAALSPSHLHVELLLAKPAWQKLLIAASEMAVKLGCALEVGLFAREQQFTDQIVQEVADLARTRAMPIRSWLVYQPKGFPASTMIARARRLLSGACAGARIGGGSWSGYCLLNENRPDFSILDIVAFECNPQGHACDSSTVMENVWAMGEAVSSARAIAGKAAVAVAPLRMMPREGEAANNPRRPCDPRQSSLFGAAWACGALSRILAAGPESISCFELLGDNGLVTKGVPAAAYPLYHLFADLAEFAGGRLVSTNVDLPLRVAALTLALGGRRRTLLANLSSQASVVGLSGLAGAWSLRRLDEFSVAEASSRPLDWRSQVRETSTSPQKPLLVELAPYGSCCIDSSSD